MLDKIMKMNKWDKTIVYIVLIFSIFNACLRLTPSGASSLFRIISPIVFIKIIYNEYTCYIKEIKFLGLVFLYSTFVSLMFYQHISFRLWIFVCYVFMVYVFVKYLLIKYSKEEFWRFINIVTIITVLLCWIQYFTRIPFPFLEMAHEPGVNLFMSNENELAAPLSFMFLIYFYKLLFEKNKNVIIVLLNIAFFIFINDAKLSLIGVLMGTLSIVLFWLYTKKLYKYLSIRSYLLIILGIFFVSFFVLIIVNPTIQYRNYEETFNDLIFNPIVDILTLNTSLDSGGGSIVDRTEAIVYGIKELINSHFFGIGWGNSIEMLKKTEYALATAASMHNLIFQIIIEFGYLSLLFIFMIMKRVFKLIKNIKSENINALIVSFVIGFIFISSQSSIGILSNYYGWIIVFYIALIKEDKLSKNDINNY